MKKILFFIALLCFQTISFSQIQTKYLDINQVNAGVGQYDYTFNVNLIPSYEVPAGSGSHSLYAARLWITAEDDYSLIYCTAETYGYNHDAFFPGPLKDDGTTDSIVSENYNKLWKINRLDIEEMQYRYQHGLLTQPGYTIPDDILTWPANGDVSQGYSQNIAPYYDANGDNIYDVYDGDYPLIHGDQEIYCITNDNLPSQNSTTNPLKIEVHRSFYAYACPTAIDSTDEINYTTFLHYKIINKSDVSYSNTMIGLFVDGDISNSSDDLIGTNVELKSAYFYDKCVDTSTSYGGYGLNPPAISITYLKGIKADIGDWKDNDNDGQIDEPGETCDFNYSMYFDRVLGAQQSDPSETMGYFYYMRGKWKDASSLTYGGGGYNMGTITKYAFPGNSDPNNIGTGGVNPGFAWTDTISGDRRSIVSMGPVTFEPSDTAEFTVAIVWSRDTTDLIDSNNVQKLFRDIANVRYWYDNHIETSCLLFDSTSIGVNNIYQNVNFNLYPNPVEDFVNIEYSDYNNNAKYVITDINGRFIAEQKITEKQTLINTKKLASGVYIITIYSKKATVSRKFIK